MSKATKETSAKSSRSKDPKSTPKGTESNKLLDPKDLEIDTLHARSPSPTLEEMSDESILKSIIKKFEKLKDELDKLIKGNRIKREVYDLFIYIKEECISLIKRSSDNNAELKQRMMVAEFKMKNMEKGDFSQEIEDLNSEVEDYRKQVDRLLEENRNLQESMQQLEETKNKLEHDIKRATVEVEKVQVEMAGETAFMTRMEDLMDRKLKEFEQIKDNIVNRERRTYAEVTKEEVQKNTKTLIIDLKEGVKADTVREILMRATGDDKLPPLQDFIVSGRRIILKSFDESILKVYSDYLGQKQEEAGIIATKFGKGRVTRLIIFGVPEGQTEEDLGILLRHSGDFNPNESTLEVVRINKSRSGYRNAIIEADARLSDKLLKRGRVLITYNRCRIQLYKRVIRCFRCQRFGHTAISCRDESNCAKCAGQHETKDCKKETECCINCRESNRKDDHRADSYDCNSFQEYRKKIIGNT